MNELPVTPMPKPSVKDFFNIQKEAILINAVVFPLVYGIVTCFT